MSLPGASLCPVSSLRFELQGLDISVPHCHVANDHNALAAAVLHRLALYVRTPDADMSFCTTRAECGLSRVSCEINTEPAILPAL